MGERRRRWRTGDDGRDQWHVVLIVENIPLGADHRLRKQVETLLAHGCRVSVISTRHEVNVDYRDRPGLTLHEYTPAPEVSGPVGHVIEYAWCGTAATVLLLRLRIRDRLDVVQLCQPPDIYFPVARLLRRLGVRVVADQRDLMPELFEARFPRAPRRLVRVFNVLERQTQRAVDHSLTVNDHLRQRLEEAGGRGRVSVIWNGPVLARVDTVRPRTDLVASGEQLVVWVGKMGVQDRVDLVVEVADRATRGLGHDELRFVLIGDGECLDDLRSDVMRRGLDRWVSFTGWVPEQTVFEHVASAVAGLDTSLQSEVTPVKAIEYMSFGLAFAAFDLAETRRLAQEAAVFAPPADTDALADALVGLIEDEPRRLALGRAGRRRVEESLSWERQEEAYLSAVGPSGPPS